MQAKPPPALASLRFAALAVALCSALPVPRAVASTDCAHPVWVLVWEWTLQVETLHRMDPRDPTTFTAGVPITGLASNNPIQSIAIDPESGVMYGVTNQADVVTIDVETGAVAVTGNLGIPLATPWKLRYDPVGEKWLLIDNVGKQTLIDPATGTVEGTLADLAYAAGDLLAGAPLAPRGFLYTNSYPGAESTRALVFDVYNQSLAEIGGGGADLATIGPHGIMSGDGYGCVELPDGTVYVSCRMAPYAPVSRLYRVDVATGSSTYVGAFGTGDQYGIDLCYDFAPAATDHDCDGYPTAVEDAAGSHRYSALETPFPDAAEAPAAAAYGALAKKLVIRLDFAAPGNDRCSLRGKIPFPGPSFDPDGQRVIIDVGGKLFAFTLDAKGKGNDGAGAKIAVKKKVVGGALAFKLTAKHVDLAAALADDGLADADLQDLAVSVGVEAWMTDVRATEAVGLLYDGIANVKGVAK